MIDISKFGSAIVNPYKGNVGATDFCNVIFDPAVGSKVLHVRKFQTLVQALGYFKYVQCTSVTHNYQIFFRGQEKAYSKSFQPALYRKCSQPGTIMDRNGLLNRQISLVRETEARFEKTDDSVVEGVLQQYGMRTRWIDAVDNIWIALWFACHHAWTWNDASSSYVHYALRSPKHEGDGQSYAYIYVLGFNKGYKAKAEKVRRSFIPGLTWGPEAEMLDLRYAVTSLMLRPHAQHGVLLRSYHHNSDGSIGYDVDMSGLIQGVVRIDLEDALEWLGHSTSLEVSSMFPPPAYDSCYRELISTERMMREQLLGKKIKPKSYRKAFVVKEGDILCVQRVG